MANRVRQCASMIPRIAANHRSAIESMKSAIQVPTIEPAVLGAQPINQEIATGGEVEIHDHIATVHGHSLVHAHDHAVIMSDGPAINDVRKYWPAIRRMVGNRVSDGGAWYHWQWR